MWQYKQFNELTTKEFHQLAKERINVFVVEQESAYQEIDDIDLEAAHIMKVENGELKAYARVFEKGDKLSFGRVLVPKQWRGEGYGRKLIEHILRYIDKNYTDWEIEIPAEAYLKDFYRSFGFKIISDSYLDYNIEHYDMNLRKAEQVSPDTFKK